MSLQRFRTVGLRNAVFLESRNPESTGAASLSRRSNAAFAHKHGTFVLHDQAETTDPAGHDEVDT